MQASCSPPSASAWPLLRRHAWDCPCSSTPSCILRLIAKRRLSSSYTGACSRPPHAIAANPHLLSGRDEYRSYRLVAPAETPRLYPVVPVLTTVLRAAAAQALELADPEK